MDERYWGGTNKIARATSTTLVSNGKGDSVVRQCWVLSENVVMYLAYEEAFVSLGLGQRNLPELDLGLLFARKDMIRDQF
jgi:hypothetical protein